QLVDGQVRRGRFRAPRREAATVRLPLGQDAQVLLPTFRGAVGAEQHVAAAAPPLRERDDRLTALLGPTGGRDRLTGSGHGGEPSFGGRLPRFARVSVRTADRRQVRLTSVRKGT